jgi:hypothetical protein
MRTKLSSEYLLKVINFYNSIEVKLKKKCKEVTRVSLRKGVAFEYVIVVDVDIDKNKLMLQISLDPKAAELDHPEALQAFWVQQIAKTINSQKENPIIP